MEVTITSTANPEGDVAFTAFDATGTRVGRLIADGPYQAPDGSLVLQVCSVYVGKGVVRAASFPAYASLYQRQGVGTKLYTAAFRCAQARGMPLASDDFYRMSDAARGWWRKQQARGCAEFMPDPDPALSLYILRREPR